MRVVSDTSPISNLAIIGRLDLLRRLTSLVTGAISHPHPARGGRVKQAFSLSSTGTHRREACVTLPVAAGWLRGESGLSLAKWHGSFAP